MNSVRRRDHAEGIERLNLLGEKLSGFEQLLSTLWDLTDEQGNQLLSAIKDGNLSLLSAIKFEDEGMHAKLDQIIHLLGVEPRRLFPADPASWQDAKIRQFECGYLERSKKEFARLEMLGVPGTQDLHQELGIAYVNVQLATPADADSQQLDRAEHVLSRYRQLTIRGPAGSGKTTLLRWVALQCAVAAANQDGPPWHSGVPFFIPLRKLRGRDRGKPEEKRLHEYAFDAGLFEQAPNGWLTRVFEERRAVLLLDGLDEIPGVARTNLWKWLAKLLHQYPGIRAFVTLRPLSAADEDDSSEWQPPAGFTPVDLQDLTPEDLPVFIRKWHDAVKAVLTDPQTQVQLDRSQDKLLAQLKNESSARVRDLCKNPLMAALICALYWRELKLPETRRELYQTSCDLLMVIRDEFREIVPEKRFTGVKKSDRFYLVKCLAWEMMQNTRAHQGQNIEVREKDARMWLRNYLPNCEEEELRNAAPKQVLDFLVQRSGLLRVPSKGFIDFHHRSFQEYLAACAAAVLNQVGNLVSKAEDDQWRETIVLAANTHDGGVTFGRNLIEGLLKEAKKQTETRRRAFIALAAACLENSEKPPTSLRAEVESQLRRIIPPRSVAEGEAIAVGGEVILPYLSYEKLKGRDKKTQKVLVACAAAIARIGGESARRMLLDEKGYGGIDRPALLSQICNCGGIEPLDIPAFADKLTSLVMLHDFYRQRTTRIGNVAARKDFTTLNLIGLDKVLDFSPLSKMTNLRCLLICECHAISDISFLTSLTNLNHLTLQDCDRLIDITPIRALTSLIELNLAGCPNLSDLSPLMSLANLQELVLSDSTGVRDLSPIATLTNLVRLIIVRCHQLGSDPQIRRLRERGVEVRL